MSLRDALARVRLASFATRNEAEFKRALERWTRSIEERLPRRARSWGLARKCLNIFLRDCYYNVFLCNEFGATVSEDWFEIPLDSITGKFLRRSNRRLPRWPGVKKVGRAESAAFQAEARRVAAAWGITRVHLDTYVWVQQR